MPYLKIVVGVKTNIRVVLNHKSITVLCTMVSFFPIMALSFPLIGQCLLKIALSRLYIGCYFLWSRYWGGGPRVAHVIAHCHLLLLFRSIPKCNCSQMRIGKESEIISKYLSMDLHFSGRWIFSALFYSRVGGKVRSRIADPDQTFFWRNPFDGMNCVTCLMSR